MKILVAFISWVAILLITIIIGITLEIPDFIGLAAGIIIITLTIRHFIISVPEVTGLVTIDLFTGKLRPYGTGLHFIFPWEQVKAGNYINLRLVTQERTENYPASDGPALNAKWSFQYKPTVQGLPRHITVDETTINKGIADVGGSFLGATIASQSAETSRNETEKIEKGLQKKFEDATICDKTGAVCTIEDLYGIDLVRMSLADIDYEEKFQQARTSKAVAKKIKEIAEDIQTETTTGQKKDIPDKDALNTALIINKDVVKHVQEVEGKGGQALAALLMAMARGGSGGGDKDSGKKGGGKK